MTYDRLLLATGAAPRRLAVPGLDLDGVYYLRDVADADALRERIDQGARLVVVGGGWIGAEVAASARQKGAEVAVLGRRSLPLERILGAELGVIYRDLHLQHGVDMRTGTEVVAFEGSTAVERVLTKDGDTVECDFVAVGIGVSPRTELAESAGLEVNDASPASSSRPHPPESSPPAT